LHSADRAARHDALTRIKPSGDALIVSAHRNRRGPYTAAGALARLVVPTAMRGNPDLVQRHDVELLSVAPELRDLVDASRETLTSLAVPHERTRFYSRLRTLRVAHGLTEFFAAALADRPEVVIYVDQVEHADPTDAEFVATMLRRLDPTAVRVVIGSATDVLPEPLADAAADFAMGQPVAGTPDPSAQARDDLAAEFVADDCTSDVAAEIAAYQSLPESRRRALHDARLAALCEPEPSQLLGAVPFHAERGSDPAGPAVAALRYALDYCIDMGFYDATVDYGQRGLRLVDIGSRPDQWWAFTTKMTTALAALSRAEEAEALYDGVRRTSTDPVHHMAAAYATAMLYTRHHENERKSDQRATAWINEAIAIAGLLPEAKERAFQSAFNRNGLALIEVHLRNLPAALELVNDALGILDSELDPAEHRLHRSVLVYNRGQVYAGMGQIDLALQDYTSVIEADPNYPEYYLDRGSLLRRAGREEAALADYERVIALSPPFPEVYYNRADVRRELGDVSGALADYAYVLELQPDFLDVFVNRAGLLLELGDVGGAAADVAAGLALDPDNPHLLCVQGQLLAADGDSAGARAYFDRAIALAPQLSAGYANRAVLAFAAGDAAAAVTDLTSALDIEDTAALRFNRAAAYGADGRVAEAIADLRRARELDPDDPDIAAALAERREDEAQRIG
jgi:tetratricopeptide (TPR) repeat protein